VGAGSCEARREVTTLRDFVVFFGEKEGTSPLVRLLDNFDRVSVVHQVENRGWEPFDRHNCGPMPIDSLEECLEIVFGPAPVDFERLNRIYSATAARPLEPFVKDGCAGFKMRFASPVTDPPVVGRIPVLGNLARNWYADYQKRRGPFRRTMFDLLKRNGVVVFLAIRQNLLRWALSKYHGDGTGKAGHLQFKLASGQIGRDDIPKINVDCDRLAGLIASCRKLHDEKRSFLDDLAAAGIPAHPVLYEDFLEDKVAYFRQICDHLEIPSANGEIEEALAKGAYFKRVHSDDLSEFVNNHEEVLDRFEDRYDPWR
jgi:hypothetical protein